MKQDRLEMGIPVMCVVLAHHLSDRVHGKLRRAAINRENPRKGGNDGANGTPASAVGSHREFLHGNAGPLGRTPEDARRDGIGGISLVGIVLDDEAVIDFGCHGGVMLGGVVRVLGVGHV